MYVFFFLFIIYLCYIIIGIILSEHIVKQERKLREYQ